MKKNKGSAIVLLLIIVVLAVIILSCAYYFIKKQDIKNSEEISNSNNYLKEINITPRPLVKNGVYTNTLNSWRVNSSDYFDLVEINDGEGISLNSKEKTKPGSNGLNEIYPLYSISINTVKKVNFVPVSSKVGMIKYDDKLNALIDVSDGVRCLPVDEKYKSLDAVEYAGSMMSDPVYSKYAIVTNDDYIILIDITSYEFSESLNGEVSKILASFTLPVGVSGTAQNCVVK